MPKVRFVEQGLEVDVPLGTTILEAAHEAKAPEGSACGGVCACSTCHVYVLEGGALLTEAEEGEEDILDKAFDVRPSSRLGCQAALRRDGVVVVKISDESLDTFYNERPDLVRPPKRGA